MATTYQLQIKTIFNTLSPREKLYAHHLSQAAWQGSRIILRQTSPESAGIFDFILELHNASQGQWAKLTEQTGVAGQFLSHLGNYYADGNRKVVPRVSADSLRKMAGISSAAISILDDILEPLLDVGTISLGFLGAGRQSMYYPGAEIVTKEEISVIAGVMERNLIEPENTRLRKRVEDGNAVFDVLRASAEISLTPTELPTADDGVTVRLVCGDHAVELAKICAALHEATKYASNDTQVKILAEYIESFTTGSTEAYRRSQKTWVTDQSPRIESIFGFVEPYRDPYGVRAEWEGIVSISDPCETEKLAGLVKESAKVISLLPWASDENDGKGPFETSLFQSPDFTIVHALACCASVVWDGVNLPNRYPRDMRHKNILFWNLMTIRLESRPVSRYIHPSETEPLKTHTQTINFITTSLHELIGHGSGKLLSETAPNVYNFDINHPPINPLTNRPIELWYKPGQTWTSVFGKLATTVEKCRANLISYYIADEK
ncbi:peptidase family M49-domain-containing protein [Podospora fimiseda]|uniref:Peptidase family M49-domain-containing protein n=1 Tax=Podospora fimiseda TaxID=252190 RepID=A0AAN6YMH9_9PEZI|nr:peptidase family M49-domain-containing protein [Podospora fimiseda]